MRGDLSTPPLSVGILNWQLSCAGNVTSGKDAREEKEHEGLNSLRGIAGSVQGVPAFWPRSILLRCTGAVWRPPGMAHPWRRCTGSAGGQIVTMDDKGHYIDAWDLLIAHPPCTYLSNAGARHLWKGHQLQEDRVMKGILGRDLFMRFWWADIPRICVENPVPSKVFCLPEYTQIIQPYQFGHPYSKKTCLWLKNLDPIMPTNIVEPIATWCPSGSYSHKHDEKSKGMFTRDRARNRAKTFPGVARAFAEQFGGQI